MIQTIKKLVISLVAGSALLFPLAVPMVAHAADISSTPDVNSSLCQGSNLQVGNTAGCTPGDTSAQDSVNKLLAFIINVFSIIVGVVAVIMIIVGGLKYITSGGDSGNITGAKNTILYAIIGLVVVAIAQFVVHFVIARTGTIG